MVFECVGFTHLHVLCCLITSMCSTGIFLNLHLVITRGMDLTRKLAVNFRMIGHFEFRQPRRFQIILQIIIVKFGFYIFPLKPHIPVQEWIDPSQRSAAMIIIFSS